MADAGQLSKRERQIMDAVYAHGEATPSQVFDGIPDLLMQGNARTLLRILEKKGLSDSPQAGTRIHLPPNPGARPGRAVRARARAGCVLRRLTRECRRRPPERPPSGCQAHPRGTAPPFRPGRKSHEARRLI